MEQKSSISLGNRSFSMATVLFTLFGVLLVGFLIYGSFNQPADETAATMLLGTDSFPTLALLAFIGGLFSFLSPCTLPILPAYFAFAFRGGRTTIAANTMAFMLGLASMFSLLGAGASVLGNLLFQSQQLILIAGGAVIILLGIMSLLGGGFSGSMGAAEQQHSRTMGGSFIFGLTFAVGWSSCVGPILGIVLSLAATTASVTNGMMLLFIYAVGLGLPLILVSVFMGRLPKNNIVWRMLRGRGWMVEAPVWVPALAWGFGAWLVGLPLLRYAFPTWDIDANPLLEWELNISRLYIPFSFSAIEIGAFVLALVAAVVIAIAISDSPKTMLTLHSTQLFTGVLFLLMGVLLINNKLSVFASLEGTGLAERLLDFEYQFLERFGQ